MVSMKSTFCKHEVYRVIAWVYAIWVKDNIMTNDESG
jgi:hypothetical protein